MKPSTHHLTDNVSSGPGPGLDGTRHLLLLNQEMSHSQLALIRLTPGHLTLSDSLVSQSQCILGTLKKTLVLRVDDT